MRRIWILLWPAALVFGLVAEWVEFGFHDPGLWIPDLAVGWFLIGCGLIATSRHPESHSGSLMTATGFTWFLGNFAGLDNELAAWVATSTVFLHRGPLFHLVLTYPDGRAFSRLTRLAVIAGYAAALVAPIWRNNFATLMISAALLAVCGYEHARAVGEMRRARLFAFRATAAVSFVLGGTALIELIIPVEQVPISSLQLYRTGAFVVYGLMLVGVTGALFVGLESRPWKRTAMADLVVELGEARAGTVRSELARALGDPSLEVGYLDDGSGHFVDAQGEPLRLPETGDQRSMTQIDSDGQPIAVLIHDPELLGDPGLREAVKSAAQLAASNARLHQAVQSRLTELKASRRRILQARDHERRLLDRRLRTGAEQSLDRLSDDLAQARSHSTSRSTTERIEQAQTQLKHARDEIEVLARGLHPRSLSREGLSAALASLTEGFTTPVSIAVASPPLSRQVEAACYFLCSEALANVAKHAAATRVSITIATMGMTLMVRVEDDGVGGADPSRGTGLVGLGDRLDSLGGTLSVVSDPGHGTVLAAEIPLGGETDLFEPDIISPVS